MSQHTARTNHEVLADVFGTSRHEPSRTLYPQQPEKVDELVYSHFSAIKKLGRYITLFDGAFDVPHANHDWVLRHCKAEGALRSYEHTSPTPELIRQALAKNAIHLAVTVDADHKVRAKKGGVSAKGGVSRPIYDWQSRAHQIMNYNFAIDGTIHHVVDTATVEGDPLHIGTSLETTLTLASFLQQEKLLGTMIIHEEHASKLVDSYNKENIEPVVIPIHQSTYQLNPSGEAWRSSGIIKRTQGKGAPMPLTRPTVDEYGRVKGGAL